MSFSIIQNLICFDIFEIGGFVYRHINALRKNPKMIVSVWDQQKMIFHLTVNMVILLKAKILCNFSK